MGLPTAIFTIWTMWSYVELTGDRNTAQLDVQCRVTARCEKLTRKCDLSMQDHVANLLSSGGQITITVIIFLMVLF